MLKVCISGLGRTGKEIAKAILNEKDLQLVSAVCSPDSKSLSKDVGHILGMENTGACVFSSDHLEELIFKNKPDVVIDFSNPRSALKNAMVFSKYKINIVIGTTGFSALDLKRLLVLTRKYKNGIVYAPNITLGVNVMMLLTNLTASLLSSYDFHITEIHHRKKLDSPSGTAKKIANEIKNGIANQGNHIASAEIPITSIRAGGVVGKHEVMIVGEEDKIEISHESFSRKAFAQGAIKAARYIHKKAGFYEMKDVLNLEKVLTTYMENSQREIIKRKSRYSNSISASN